MAALGAAGRSWDHPQGVVVRLGSVLEPSWGRFGCVLDGLGRFGCVLEASWSRLGAVFGASWRFEWRPNEAFHLACGLKIDFEWILLPKVKEKTLDFIAKVLGIIVF